MLYLPEDGGVWVYKKELENHAVSGEKKGRQGLVLQQVRRD